MLFISIPVHEKLDVVLNQCENFVYYTDSIIVLHVGNCELRQQLQNALSERGLNFRVYVNPNCVKTAWGNIFNAHLLNLEFIAERFCPRSIDKVAFHASNDMFISKGVNRYIDNISQSIYHARIYNRDCYWWPAKEAFKDDMLINCMGSEFGENWTLVGSQIEGSVYLWETLVVLLRLLERNPAFKRDLGVYPREEILFPTIAFNIGDVPCRNPYLYSEVFMYDATVYKCYKFIDNIHALPNFCKFLTKRCISAVLRRLSFYKLNLDNVRLKKFPHVIVEDKHFSWQPHKKNEEIFAVKRVARNIEDPIRKYISQHLC